MIQRGIAIAGSRILILGLTFKENCADLRNTRVIDLAREFGEYRARVEICDPWANAEEARREYGLDMVDTPEPGAYDAIVIAVAHEQFRALGAAGARAYGKPGALLYDIKSLYPRDEVDGRL